MIPESLKCSQVVRQMPLERFRLSSDSRKWKQLARSRQDVLLRLSTYANGDGTFERDGKNYSPSERKIIQHIDRKKYYRRTEELRRLGLLSWTREQYFYGRRIYTIHLSGKQVSDSPKTGVRFDEKQASDSETGVMFDPKQVSDSQEQVSPWVPVTGVTMGHLPSSPITSSLRDENHECSEPPLSDSSEPLGFSTNDDVATAANEQSHDLLHAVLPKQQAAGHRSIHPTNWKEGKEGLDSLRESALEEQIEDEELEPVTAQDRRRLQQSYAIEKATEFRNLPQYVRDEVKGLRQKFRVEWDYWRTHDEDGALIDDESDYRLPVFPSPKADSQLKLAKMLPTYTESQIVSAWKKFVNRPQGFDGLDFPWSNFFLEFDDYVEAEEPVAVGAHHG